MAREVDMEHVEAWVFRFMIPFYIAQHGTARSDERREADITAQRALQ